MEVPAGQDGIQRLLAAEQEAQAIVAKARKGALGRVWRRVCGVRWRCRAGGSPARGDAGVTAATSVRPCVGALPYVAPSPVRLLRPCRPAPLPFCVAPLPAASSSK